MTDKRRLAHPAVTREVVQKAGFQFKKSLGQNFLIDEQVLDDIVDAAELGPDDGVIEVGPGIGTLTQSLADHAAHVVAIEKDHRLLPLLAQTLEGYDNIVVEAGDVLEIDLHALIKQQFPSGQVSVVANLPYYITTPIVMKLLEERLPLKHIVVMVQKEVAERMAAKPGGKEYGILSVAVQYYTEPSLVCAVPHDAFMPEPGVESSVIKLAVRKEPPVQVSDQDLFFAVVKAAFAQRRKTLLNNMQSSNLYSGRGKEDWSLLLQRVNITPSRRAETLSLAEFAQIANELSNLI